MSWPGCSWPGPQSRCLELLHFPTIKVAPKTTRPAWVLNCFSCVWLCNPMDGSLPGSSVHGILQTRILEWVAISSSRGSSQPWDQTWVSCVSCIGMWVVYHLHHLGSPRLAWIPVQMKYDFCSESWLSFPSCLKVNSNFSLRTKVRKHKPFSLDCFPLQDLVWLRCVCMLYNSVFSDETLQGE